jgi:hypothetical protein
MAFTPHSFFLHATRSRKAKPRLLEVFETEGITLLAERLDDRHFEVRLGTEDGLPVPPAEIGGIPVVGVEHLGRDADDCLVMRLGLAQDLPAQAFEPGPAGPNEIPFEDALAVAVERERPVLINRVREGATYWFFPIYEIGSYGYVVNKRSGIVTGLGSSALGVGASSKVDAWLWGYERGLLSEIPRDFQIDAIADLEAAMRVVQALDLDATRLETEALPIRYSKVTRWELIGPLYADRGASFTWSCP